MIMGSYAEQSIIDYRLKSAQYTGYSSSFEEIRDKYARDISYAAQVGNSEANVLGSNNEKKIGSSSIVEKDDSLEKVATPAERQKKISINNSHLSPRFTPNYEWEGYVVSVDRTKFIVNLSDVRGGEGIVTDQAEFDLTELPEADQRRIEPGSIVRWLVGLEIKPNDQRQRVSRVHLRRLPVFTKHDVDRALEEAMNILQGMKMDDAS